MIALGLLGGAVAALAGAALAIRRRFVVVTVAGRSMLPTYRDGDRVLVRRTRMEGLRAGQVVVVEHPRADRRWRPSQGDGPAPMDDQATGCSAR
jgi:signal peptidase I